MWLLKNTFFHILVASLLAIAVYSLGLSGSFYFDDEWNILKNQALHLDNFDLQALWSAAQSGGAGPLGRPIPVLTFVLNHIFFGLDPFYFKVGNLIVHLFCGWAIYALTLALSGCLPGILEERRRLFAFLVMLLWLLHPLNLTTVLYPVQRMAGLSALFCLLGMLSYVRARQIKGERPFARALLYALCVFVFWPLALYSKENALLMPAYIFLIELIFLKFRNADSGKSNSALIFSHGALIVLPGILVAFYLLFFFPEWILKGYENRDFSLVERLLTQSRVLFFYASQVVLPLNGNLGLFHDDFVLSTSVLSPKTTLLSIVSLLVALVFAIAGIRKFPVIAFGILFFLIAHSIESTIFPLELIHEHRNYLAIYSILFAIGYYLVTGAEKFSLVKALFACGFVVFLGLTTLTRSAVWGEPVVHVITEVSNHPQSPRANYGMGKQYAIYANSLDESPQKTEALETAVEYFKKSAELGPAYLDGLFGLLMIEGLEGREMSEESYQTLIERLRTAPFSNNTYNYLHGVLGCLEAGDCTLADDRLQDIIEACRDNPGFFGTHARNVLERYQRYSG